MGGKQSAETTAKVVEGSNAAKAEKPNAKQEQKSHGHAPKGDVTVANAVVFEARPSMLSSEHPDNNYRGFVNVLIILLVLGNLKIVIRNLLKYGLLVRPLAVLDLMEYPNIVITLLLSIFVLLAHVFETSPIFPDNARSYMNFINACASVVFVWGAMWSLDTNPGGGVIALLSATVAFMKIVSFTLVCRELRLESKGKDKVFKPTLQQLLYFVAAPTMVFKPVYPRTPKVRWGWVARRMAELIGLWAGIAVICVQYVGPGLKNTVVPLQRGNLYLIVEGLCKLAVPNFIIWILGFYAIFHLQLNIIAELTRFADREFYKDWWNSSNLGYFWRTWNLPVHSWMVAHVYIPLHVQRKWSKESASFLIFILSAIFHELIVSIPFRNFKLLAFGGMMAQVPLIELTKCLKGTQTGNVIFWLVIMLGQPMIVLLYFRDALKGTSGVWTHEDTQVDPKP